MIKRTITSIEEICQDSYILRFQRDFEFIPGQVIGISMNLHSPPRLYSIASASSDPEVSILFREKKDGLLTPWLSERKAGDTIYTSPVSGNFFSEKNEKAYWIGAGTGIAPFASMFYSGFGNNKILIQGARDQESAYFMDDFSSALGKNYIICSSRVSFSGAYQGRITAYLQEKANLPKEYKYYLCGSAEMVVETRDVLISKGIGFEMISSEIYF